MTGLLLLLALAFATTAGLEVRIAQEERQGQLARAWVAALLHSVLLASAVMLMVAIARE